ncbi:HNH endonuclease [Methylobacterium sp. P31]
MKVVFDTRPGSRYRDSVERYHFPSRYLRTAIAAVGDWAVYYEPARENGRRAYVAVARVERIEPDIDQPGHYFAYIRDYLPFDMPIPLKGPLGYLEARLRQIENPRDTGRALQGRSVRDLSEEDFRKIIKVGFGKTLAPDNEACLDSSQPQLDSGTAVLLPDPPADRIIERVLHNRIARDADFRRAVLDAYENTCAVTGLRIIDRGGRVEAQAAHIVPVAEGGLDIVQNGIALCATAHWLFDRHLISIDERWRLLVFENKVPASLQTIFVPAGAPIITPKEIAFWPRAAFLEQHRKRFFLG